YRLAEGKISSGQLPGYRSRNKLAPYQMRALGNTPNARFYFILLMRQLKIDVLSVLVVTDKL
ncbi:MAG: hypothetical protein IJE88_03345, partial [Akkermansia sp.]|nr:hypothetical protein [Akkermansia sp.]